MTVSGFCIDVDCTTTSDEGVDGRIEGEGNVVVYISWLVVSEVVDSVSETDDGTTGVEGCTIEG